MRVSTRWEIADAPAAEVSRLASALGIPSLLARLVWNRGCRDESSARVYLNASLRDLADPFLLPGMTTAVERAWRAIEAGESIVLYGDYDVDGVTSVATLKRVLSAVGTSNVRCFLPDRFDEGYGLTPSGVERCLAEGKPGLLIVLDCGTNSSAEIAGLQAQGVDVVVLDHHEPSTPAHAHALVNYKLGRPGAQSSVLSAESSASSPSATLPAQPSGLRTQDFCTEYCTAGLVFKFCHALLKIGRRNGKGKALELDLKPFLDLVALATVADIAPLTGENRILTRHGLRQMTKTESVGLRALMQVSKMTSEATAYDCGFKLGPRLNAAGRLESAVASLNLLLSGDEAESREIAQGLDETNRERQSEEKRVLAEARAEAEAQFLDEATRVIVVARAGWHEGVVGIVASRLCREFHLPSFVVALDHEGKGKGSGRSIEGFNLAQAIEATRPFLLRGGGHTMAAGVSLEASRVGAWREALQEHAKRDQGLNAERLKRVIRVDAEVTLPALGMEFVESLKKLEPCGTGNPRPMFVVRGVEIAGEPRTVGGDKQHLKLWLRQDGVALDAIAFGRGSMPARKGMKMDIVFEPEMNEYQGKRSVQLNIKEISEVADGT